jgi:acyl-CoA synthetase (AMP-forming)/AMP-acid ligase II
MSTEVRRHFELARMLTLADVIEEHGRGLPDHIATICGEHRFTWTELNDRVGRLASGMRSLGVEHGDRVLWLGPGCHRWLESLLAAGILGAIFCPLDTQGSIAAVEAMTNDADPKLVISLDEDIQVDVGHVERIDSATVYEALLTKSVESAKRPRPNDTDPLLLMYSTRTDSSRGALLSHRAWVVQSVITAIVEGIDVDSIHLNDNTACDLDNLRLLLATIQLGGTNVFGPAPTDLISAGAVVGDNSDQPVTPGFGQVELAGFVTYQGIAGPCKGNLGHPSPMAEVDVCDVGGKSMPLGEIGELVVRGPMVMNGYHRQPDLNQQLARGDWHHTGEFAYRETDGSLTAASSA